MGPRSATSRLAVWIILAIVLVFFLVAAPTCEDQVTRTDESIPLPNSGVGLEPIASGVVVLGRNGDHKYWIYGSASFSMTDLIADVEVRLRERHWEIYPISDSRPPVGVRATNGATCLSYSDLSRTDNAVVASTRSAILEQDPDLSIESEKFRALLLIGEFPCP